MKKHLLLAGIFVSLLSSTMVFHAMRSPLTQSPRTAKATSAVPIVFPRTPSYLNDLIVRLGSKDAGVSGPAQNQARSEAWELFQTTHHR